VFHEEGGLEFVLSSITELIREQDLTGRIKKHALAEPLH
jgi:hypothetical protein